MKWPWSRQDEEDEEDLVATEPSNEWLTWLRSQLPIYAAMALGGVCGWLVGLLIVHYDLRHGMFTGGPMSTAWLATV